MIARDIMTTELIYLEENNTIKEVAKKMNETDVGSVLVFDQNHQHLSGIITDRDIVIRGVAMDVDVNTGKASDVMSTDVVTAMSDDDIDHVIDLMSDYQIKRVPIVENDNIVGIISLRDLSQTYMLEDEAGDVLNDITEEVNVH